MTRDEALALLRGGAEGISEWNRRRAAGEEIPRLGGEDLSACVLIWANLRKMHLEGADLIGAHLEGADLREAHLEAADLREAHLERDDLGRATDLNAAHLEGAVLSKAHLEGAQLYHAHLEGAYLTGAHLEGANLHYAHLEGADLRRAHLERDDLERATDLEAAHLEGAYLVGAHLNGAHMKMAHLEGADLYGADLKGADLQSVFVGDYLCGEDAEGMGKGRALRRTVFGDVDFDKHTKVKGLDTSAANFADKPLFKRFIEDEQYLAHFRDEHPRWYWLWKVSCDCGRSIPLWAFWSFLLVLLFAWVYWGAPPLSLGTLHPKFDPEYQTWFTNIYFSAVTFTTLGFGDVRPMNAVAQIVTTIEVFTGYVMLGGLISIFANKLARRA